MKRLASALLLVFVLLGIAPAQAQNVICATAPSGDSSNRCASTAFVQGAIAGVGDVTGPAASVDNQIVLFSGTTGKIIKDNGTTTGMSIGSSGTALKIDNGFGPTNVVYFPAGFVNSSIFFGNGGASLLHTGLLEGYYNTCVGLTTALSMTKASYNTCMGFESMEFCTICNFNSGFGEATLIYNITGNGNTAVGWKALLGNVGVGYGDYNTGVGYSSGWLATVNTVTQNTSIGAFSLSGPSLSGNANTVGGYRSGIAISSANNSAFWGPNAGDTVASGSNNTLIGPGAGSGLVNGGSNTIVGACGGFAAGTSNLVELCDGAGSARFVADASQTTLGAPLTAQSGGTGTGTYAVGDLLTANTTTTLAKLADVATGSLLASGGVGVIPAYCVACTLTTSLTVPTVLGSTGTTGTLTLQSTSGAGGTTDKVNFKVGNNGATNAGNVYGTGRWNIGATDVAPDSLLTLMGNTATTVAPAASQLHIVAADSANARITLDTFGSGGNYVGRRANGSLASKTAVVATNNVFALQAQGWDTSTYTQGGGLQFVGTETYTAANHGMEVQFYTTANGGGALTQSMTLQNSGGLSIGTTTDLGVGTVLANGAIKSLSTTVASSKTTGSIIAGGGIGVAGATYTDTLNIITVANTSTTRALCWDNTTGLVSENGTVGTCTVSTLAAKNLTAPLTAREGFDIVMAMEPWRYTLKEGPATYKPGEQIGFIAEYALQKEPRLVAVSGEHVDGFLYEQYTAALTGAIHYLQAEIEQLKRSVH